MGRGDRLELMFARILIFSVLVALSYCGIVPIFISGPMPVVPPTPMIPYMKKPTFGMNMFYPKMSKNYGTGNGMYHNGMTGTGMGFNGMGYKGVSMNNFYPMGGYQYQQIDYDPNWRMYTQGGGQFGEFSHPMWNQPQYPWNQPQYNSWYPDNNMGNNWGNDDMDWTSSGNWNNQDGVWNQQDHWSGDSFSTSDDWKSPIDGDAGMGLQSH